MPYQLPGEVVQGELATGGFFNLLATEAGGAGTDTERVIPGRDLSPAVGLFTVLSGIVASWW